MTWSESFFELEALTRMCTRVTCPSCNKPTYSGCGRHVEQVLGNVPVEQRCNCRERDAAGDDAAKDPASLFRRLFGG